MHVEIRRVFRKPGVVPHVFAVIMALASPAWALTEVSSLPELAAASAGEDQEIRMKPGVYRMADYLTPEVLEAIRKGVDTTKRRPPVPMFVFRGNRNRIHLNDVTIEIDTSLYKLLPKGGYTRCLIVAGAGNRIEGLTIRNTGPNTGSGGNILSVQGDDNTLENVTLHVRGSFPWGYGDLLGKGGPNLVNLAKQSGIQVLGNRTLLRRCRVFSRAFGHCFYIQSGDGIRFEDCHAEGSVRSTDDMLSDRSGPAYEQGFRSVYRNRDGRFMITPGCIKSLSEDGYRTYGEAGSVSLVNCTAINTRAGFEIGAKDDAKTKTVIDNCVARGCERAFLIGSHTIVRKSRGDVVHGPLLYLRGGRDSDVELELIGDAPEALVHVIATIAGENHRVKLTAQPFFKDFPALPIMVGFGMPSHAEMASASASAPAIGIHLQNSIEFSPVIVGDKVVGGKIESTGRKIDDRELRKDPGPWDLPPNGIATGKPE